MQVTAFKQVKNNAGGHLASLISIGGTSLVLQSGEGAKFPAPGNPFYVTVWNDTTYPDPSDDPNMARPCGRDARRSSSQPTIRQFLSRPGSLCGAIRTRTRSALRAAA